MIEKTSVLVVDDEPELCEILEFKFQQLGFKTYNAYSGNAALKALSDHKIDAVVSDIRMNNGSGIELLRSMRATGKDQVVLFVTGYAEFSLGELFHLGVEAIFSKPVNLDLIGECLQSAIDFKKHQDGCQRIYQRYSTVVQVDLNFSKGNQVKASLKNLSQGGMFIQMDEAFPQINEVVKFVFNDVHGGVDAQVFKGLCKWVREHSDEYLPSGIGVQFMVPLDIDENDKLMRVLNAAKTRKI